MPRLPTAVLSTGLMLLAFLSIACGLMLDTVTRGRRELKLLAYLAQRAPAEERAAELRARTMRELVRTNNAVLITAIEALLKGADIPHVVLDQHMSVLEGSLGILPRRILVDDEHQDDRAPAAGGRRPRPRAAAAMPARPDAGD